MDEYKSLVSINGNIRTIIRSGLFIGGLAGCAVGAIVGALFGPFIASTTCVIGFVYGAAMGHKSL